MAPGLQPPVPGLPVLGEFQGYAEPGQRALVVLEARVVVRNGSGVHRGIGVAEKHRVVPGGSGFEGHIGKAGVQRGAVLNRPVHMLVGAGQQTGPTRTARRRLGVVGSKPNSLSSQPVQVGCADHRMAGCS